MFGGDDVDRMLEEAERRNRLDRRASYSRPMTERRTKNKTESRGHSRSRSRRRSRRGRSPSFGHEVGVTRDLREKIDLERDEKTVFVCQIHPKSNEKDLFLFFSRVGKVIDIQLMRDHRTLKSKGLAYVEFDDVVNVWSAIRLSGEQLGGFPIKVQLTQAEKNRAAREARATGPPSPDRAGGSSRGGSSMSGANGYGRSGMGPPSLNKNDKRIKLYISNIPAPLKENDLRPMFGALGEVASLEIKVDRQGNSLGYGFVEYTTQSSALEAIGQMNGLEIMKQKLKVAPAEHDSHLSMAAAAASAGRGGSAIADVAVPSASSSSSISGAGTMSSHPQSSAADILHQLQLGQSGGANANGIGGSNPSSSMVIPKDESLMHLDGNGGIILSSQDKLSLMQRLAAAGSENNSSSMPMPADVGNDGSLPGVRRSNNTSAGGSQIYGRGSVDPRRRSTADSGSHSSSSGRDGSAQMTEFGPLSRCLLLKNLFDPRKEKNPDFDREIHEDVSIEAGKYGKVLHIFVDRTSHDGLVYLKLASTSEALNVAGKLHRRNFGESRIDATFHDESTYNSRFGI